MKKITILLIVLMVISVGFLSGCNEADLKEEEEEEEKYSEFVEWEDETSYFFDSKYVQLMGSLMEDDYDGALYYCNQVRSNLDYYISECRDFYLLGILDKARDEYVDYLTLLDDAYIHYEYAVENWEIGFNLSGNQHWDMAEDYRFQAISHQTNCTKYISDWKGNG